MSLWNLFLVDEYPSYMVLILSQSEASERTDNFLQDVQMEDAGDVSEDQLDLISKAPSIPETAKPTFAEGCSQILIMLL